MDISELSRIIGKEAAELLVEECGGETVYIPTRTSDTKAEKIRSLWVRYSLNTEQISKRVGCSERHVRRVLSMN